jgi:hypothetical protein
MPKSRAELKPLAPHRGKGVRVRGFDGGAPLGDWAFAAVPPPPLSGHLPHASRWEELGARAYLFPQRSGKGEVPRSGDGGGGACRFAG